MIHGPGGPPGLAELAAEALVLGSQIVEASLKSLAAGTREGLHTCMIGGVPAAAVLPQPRNRDQLELDALCKYFPIWELVGILFAPLSGLHQAHARCMGVYGL